MHRLSHTLVMLFLAQAPGDHPDNPIFRELISDGLTVNGTTVKLSTPTLVDGADVTTTNAALKTVAGDDRAVRELLRNSVTAPFILKTRDIKAGDSILRVVDLWFVVHAKLEEVDPERALRQSGDQVVEAGNMRIETKLMVENDLKARKLDLPAPANGRKEWFSHLSGRLLDRIKVEVTDRALATRTDSSLLIATRTDHAFDGDAPFPNHWSSLTRDGTTETSGPLHPYGGGACYLKISKLVTEPGALFVEAHMLFVEPLEWFQGNPILRSKIGVIAQDQIRRLRREIEKKRSVSK